MSSDDRIPHVRTLHGRKVEGFASLAGLLVLLLLAGCSGGSTNANGGGGVVAASVSSTVAVGTAPNAVAVDSSSNNIYVTDFGTTPHGIGGCSQSGADLETIDGATLSTTSGGLGSDKPANPYSVAVNSATHEVYVVWEEYWAGIANSGDCGPLAGFVSGRDVGQFPARADVNSTTGTIYVSFFLDGAGSVGVWDSNWNDVATIPVGSAPVGIAVNATSNTIYVANSGSNNVSVIDGATNTVVATIADPNAAAPVAVAVNAATNTIYVANSQSNNLTVIDGATNAVRATVPVGAAPSGVDVDPQTNFIYVANAGNSQSGDPGNITVINGATNATTTLTDPNAKNPVAVAANPATNKIYVVNSGSNNVTVIDGANE